MQSAGECERKKKSLLKNDLELGSVSLPKRGCGAPAHCKACEAITQRRPARVSRTRRLFDASDGMRAALMKRRFKIKLERRMILRVSSLR